MVQWLVLLSHRKQDLGSNLPAGWEPFCGEVECDPCDCVGFLKGALFLPKTYWLG